MNKFLQNAVAATTATLIMCVPVAQSVAQTTDQTDSPSASESASQTPDWATTSTSTLSREAKLVGMAVIDIKGKEIGTIVNVVLGREDGAFVIIKLDKGFLQGHRLVGIYESRLQEVKERSLGVVMQLTHLRETDIKDFPTFTYTDDMKLAVARQDD